MAFNPITLAEIAVKKFMTASLMLKIKDSLDWLYGSIGSNAGNLSNGSFEIDSDSDGTPDSWSESLYAGGSYSLQNTDQAHGEYAVKFTHPGGSGNGGGYIDSDYVLVSPQDTYFAGFMIKCSVTGMKNKLEIREYDKSKIYQSTQTLYDSTSNPTAWTQKMFQYTPASGIAYIKIRLIGGFTDTDVAGDIYFDHVIHAPVTRQTNMENYAAGDLVLDGMDINESKVENAASYTQQLEFTCARSGTLRFKWTQTNSSTAGSAQCKIYRNGVAVGVEKSYGGSTTPQSMSDDVSGWVEGDLMQLYAKSAGGISVTITNFRICSAVGAQIGQDITV